MWPQVTVRGGDRLERHPLIGEIQREAFGWRSHQTPEPRQVIRRGDFTELACEPVGDECEPRNDCERQGAVVAAVAERVFHLCDQLLVASRRHSLERVASAPCDEVTLGCSPITQSVTPRVE